MPSEVQVILCCVPTVQVSVPLGVNMVMPPMLMVQVEVDAVLRPALFTAAMLQVWSPALMKLAFVVVEPDGMLSLFTEPPTYNWYLRRPLSASEEALQVNVGVLEVVQVSESGLTKSNAIGALASIVRLKLLEAADGLPAVSVAVALIR